MSGVGVTLTSASAIVAEAADSARAAEARAGVEIRALGRDGDPRCAFELLQRIWSDPVAAGATTEMIITLGEAGGCALGAFVDDRIVGAAIGMLARQGEAVSLQSYIVGVDPGCGGRSVGYALKLRQRAWALARGMDEIRWTMDPLVRRNAYFNVTKLAARLVRYEVNYYGERVNAIDGSGDSDRVVIRWDVASAAVRRACRQPVAAPSTGELIAEGAVVALAVTPDGEPAARATAPDVRRTLVLLPEDIVRLRSSDPRAALRWRHALRAAMQSQLGAGRCVTAVTKDGGYLLELP